MEEKKPAAVYHLSIYIGRTDAQSVYVHSRSMNLQICLNYCNNIRTLIEQPLTKQTKWYFHKTGVLQHFMQFIEQEYYDSFTVCFYLFRTEQHFLLQAYKNALTKMEEGREVVYFHAVRKFETFYDKIGSNIHWKLPPTSHLLTVTET
jgi:hypothetical protein